MFETLLTRFLEMRQEFIILVSKVNGFDSELADHQLLNEFMHTMNPNHHVFRKVGEMLIERTVGEVFVAVDNNIVSIYKMIESLRFEFSRREKDIKRYHNYDVHQL